MALISDSTENNATTKRNRYKVALKNRVDFENMLINTSESGGLYQQIAGNDLSDLFAPWHFGSDNDSIPTVTIVEASSGEVTSQNLLPFRGDTTETSGILSLEQAPSGGDSMTPTSSDRYYGSPDLYRDLSDIRGVGFRLPAMAVGWGYDFDGNPVPSGTDGKFKGEVTNGYEVDPKDWISAPIDLRYDKERGVWTTSNGIGFKTVKITGSSQDFNNSRYIYDFTEVEHTGEGYGGWTTKPGGITGQAYNGMEVASNASEAVANDSIVFVAKVNDEWWFSSGTSISSSAPIGSTQYQVYQMVSNSEAGWDYGRFP